VSPSRTRRSFALALVLVSSTACTLTTPLDGLSGGPAPERDAAADVTERESGAPLDSGTDAGQSRYAAAVLADSPLLYFRFGEAAGASSARDEVSGTSVPYPPRGVAPGAAGALAGEPNTAASFDGSSGLTIPSSVAFPGKLPFSAEVWIARAAAGNRIGFVIDREVWPGGRRGWLLRASDGDFGFERWRTGDQGVIEANSTSIDNRAVAASWNYVVATFDGAVMRLYVDGVLGAEREATFDLTGDGASFTVGKQNCSPCDTASFVGALDELAIYPRALSPQTIAAHLAAGRGL
jgi:hypothetical protein